jgi:chorismate mutase
VAALGGTFAPMPRIDRDVLRPLPFSEWGLGLDRPLMIAGPCSAESREQVLATAEGVKGRAVVFRAGVWKPRTRPGHFEGVGAVALEWLAEVKATTGLLTATEVATGAHVEAALKAGVDILWVGARTTPNPFSVQELADALTGVDIPVLVKNPINPDLHLWVGALERFAQAGIRRYAAVHRGFSWFERTPYRNSPMWEFPIRLKAAHPGLEILCDPSHVAGSREGVPVIAQQALDLGLSGLMIEVHPDPGQALSDAAQQLAPPAYGALLDSLIHRVPHPGEEARDRLQELRDLIDQLDEEIAQKLAARMDIAERIGDHKRAHNVAIIQPERWARVLQGQLRLARELGLGEDFVHQFMDAVHRESIRRQSGGAAGSGTPLGIPSEGTGTLARDPGTV